jgi:two-component system, NarL family, nitrate/nitrite response regulator NarL
MNRIKICIADDHKLVLEGMGTLIDSIPELELVGKFTSSKLLIENLASGKLKPQVILIDIQMPEMDGIEAVRAIRKFDSTTKIIALSMHHESHFISKMIASGANGYLMKNVDRDTFFDSIKRSLAGSDFFVEGTSYNNDPQVGKVLSQRETEILKEIVKGKSNKQIGDQFFISDRTVDTHRTNIKRKLRLSTLSQLIEYAKSHGID